MQEWKRVRMLGRNNSTACEVLNVFYSERHPFLAAHLRSLLKWLSDHPCDIWGQAVRSPLFS